MRHTDIHQCEFNVFSLNVTWKLFLLVYKTKQLFHHCIKCKRAQQNKHSLLYSRNWSMSVALRKPFSITQPRWFELHYDSAPDMQIPQCQIECGSSNLVARQLSVLECVTGLHIDCTTGITCRAVTKMGQMLSGKRPSIRDYLVIIEAESALPFKWSEIKINEEKGFRR